MASFYLLRLSPALCRPLKMGSRNSCELSLLTLFYLLEKPEGDVVGLQRGSRFPACTTAPAWASELGKTEMKACIPGFLLDAWVWMFIDPVALQRSRKRRKSFYLNEGRRLGSKLSKWPPRQAEVKDLGYFRVLQSAVSSLCTSSSSDFLL